MVKEVSTNKLLKTDHQTVVSQGNDSDSRNRRQIVERPPRQPQSLIRHKVPSLTQRSMSLACQVLSIQESYPNQLADLSGSGSLRTFMLMEEEPEHKRDIESCQAVNIVIRCSKHSQDLSKQCSFLFPHLCFSTYALGP